MKGSSRREACLRSWRAVLDDVTPFDAVVGKDVETTDRRLSIDLFRRLRLGKDVNPFNWGAIYLMTTKPQIGCALSHIALWRECAEEGRPVIVVEDDVVLKDGKERIEEETRGKDFASLVYLSKHRSPVLADHLTTFWGTQAYFLTPAAAKVLLRHAFPLSVHIDRYVAAVAAREGERGWTVATPPLRHSIQGPSSLDHSTTSKIAFASVAAFVVGATVLSLVALLLRCRRSCSR